MDKIISTTSHRDYVLIFTEQGKVYKLAISDLDGRAKYELILTINLTR